MKVKEAWSDQIKNDETNGLLDKTGLVEKPYILMGARADGKGHGHLKLSSALPEDIRDRVLFRFYRGGQVQAGSSTYEQNGSIVRVQLDSIVNAEIKPAGHTFGPTNPLSSNSDGDGIPDGEEVNNGSDPNDPSGSHSENWMITVTGVDLDPDKRMLRVKGRDFGVMSDSQMHKLRVGKQYEITIDHLGTDPEFLAENESPDYDWEATIDNLPAGVAESGSNSENEIFVVGGGKWIVDNREAVLTKEKHGDDENLTLGGRSFLLPVEFETFAKNESREIGGGRSPNWKPHELNMDTRQKEEEHYGDFKKCVAHIWSSSSINMAKYLASYTENKELFENPEILNWMVWTGSNPVGVVQESYKLNLNTRPRLADRPALDSITKYQIAPVAKGTTEPLDRLIITVIPAETVQSYDQWKINNADLGWLDDLAPPYSKIPEPVTVVTPADPANGLFNDFVTTHEVSPDKGCDWSPWQTPGSQDSYYHPDSYFEVRTEELKGTLFVEFPAHQACYNKNRELILPIAGGDVISPGSADRKAALTAGGSLTGHLNADVKPFLWALQIDGNPAVGVDLNRALSDPIMFQGVELEAYAKLRPARVPAGIIHLGQCPTKTF